jgi:hypothetical protein
MTLHGLPAALNLTCRQNPQPVLEPGTLLAEPSLKRRGRGI